MPTLFLAFANSETNPLAALREEDDSVHALLSERASRDDFRIVRESYATREIITRQLPLFQQDIHLFLYSGHAGSDGLILEDGLARAEGIAALLGRCPNLKLVVLNGCSTVGQVEALLEAGVQAVIATSAPIGDQTAKQFSISFFKELSKNRRSIRESFNRALDAANIFGDIKGRLENRGILRSMAKSAPVWGLFSEPKSDVLDNWYLPAKAVTSTANEELKEAIKAIFDEHLKAQNEDSDSQEVVLKRLPYTISEPIRKLLAPRDASGQIFYDQASPERFRMLLYAYRSTINFVVFVLLSQLWKEKIKENDLNTEGVSAHLRQWLLKDFRDDDTCSLIQLFRLLVQLFKTQTPEIPFFFSELKEVLEALETVECREALAFLEKQMADNPQSNLEYLCEDAERHLAMVLYHFGFLVYYNLTSVKDIGVLFYMNNAEATYDHRIVRLQQQITALEDRNEVAQTFYKTASVLLRHVTDKSKTLYLSPFLIDENAYTKTPKANLRYFIAFSPTTKSFHFKHVSKPEDILKIEEKKALRYGKSGSGEGDENDYYPLINGQFAAFCKDVLGKNLESL